MIRMLAGRLHVGADYLTAVRYVVSRLKGRRRAFLRLPRRTRRTIIREALKCHAANRQLYRRVMAGHGATWPWGRG
jgi:hypothetical protein